MDNREKKLFLEELDKRARRWQRKREDALSRLEQPKNEYEKKRAEIDLSVAEAALKRIEKRKEELVTPKEEKSEEKKEEKKREEKKHKKEAKRQWEATKNIKEND